MKRHETPRAEGRRIGGYATSAARRNGCRMTDECLALMGEVQAVGREGAEAEQFKASFLAGFARRRASWVRAS